MEFEGKCIIFSAPSGAGKTTIVQHLLAVNNEIEFSISATSRSMRPYEIDGKDYHFLSVKEFKSHIKENKFVEWEEVYSDHYYGTLKSEMERIWKNGKHVVFDVDVMGGIKLKSFFGDNALSVFVQAPSVEELENRLIRRGTENPESLSRRVGKAKSEMQFTDEFDYVLVNDVLETAEKEVELVVHSFIKQTKNVQH